MPSPDLPIANDLGGLYAAHSTWLQGWLRRRIGDSFVAADLAQDTFVSLLDRSTPAEAIREPRPFLATIAKRLIAHRHRRQLLETAYLEALACLPEALAQLQLLHPQVRVDLHELNSAEQVSALQQGKLDLVAFGHDYIANPDLVERLQSGAPLAPMHMATLYGGGAAGYTDYPAHTATATA